MVVDAARICAYLIATVGTGLVLAGLAVGTLRPCPDPPVPIDRGAEQLLRRHNDDLAAELRRERESHLRTLVLLDELRRTAILFPPPPSLPESDKIPATSLPVAPAGVAPIPRAKE